jgi:KUP system potassium uptake protein
MITWRFGIEAMHTAVLQTPEAAERFLSDLNSGAIPRVDGTMVFLTRSNQKVSRLVIEHVRFSGVLPRHAIALGIVFENVPRISGPRCSMVEKVGEGLWHVVARFGFFEIPDLGAALNQVQSLDTAIDVDHAVFVAARDLVVRKPNGSLLKSWRVSLFAFLYRNSAKIVDRFNLPPDRVIEIARQIEI